MGGGSSWGSEDEGLRAGGREGREGTGARKRERDPLTTGLARAELAVEEARELDLKWPLSSEACPPSWPQDAEAETEEQVGEVSEDAETETEEQVSEEDGCPVSGEVSQVQLREEGEVSVASGGPPKEGSVVPAPDPRPLRTHNLIILSKNVGFSLGRVRVTQSTCLAGGGGTPSFCKEKLGRRGRGWWGTGTVSCLPAWDQKRGFGATEKSASLLSLQVDTK